MLKPTAVTYLNIADPFFSIEKKLTTTVIRRNLKNLLPVCGLLCDMSTGHLLILDRAKKKKKRKKCVSGFSSEKTRYGQLALSFY